MVVGWLVKVLILLAVLGVAVVDLGSPLVARTQADDAATEIASEAALVYGSNQSVRDMQARCADVAEQKSVRVETCEIAAGKVQITIVKDAYYLLLGRISALESWYSVQVSRTTDPK